MNRRFWVRWLDSFSDNRKSKTCTELSRSIQNRKLVGLVALVVTFTFGGAVATAQQPKNVTRIGYLSAFEPTTESTRSEAIRLALRELGYIEGQNIAIEYRYAEGKSDRYPELAAELVPLKVDIIVVAGADRLIRVVKNTTKTIPIVMTGGGSDPVEAGLVESLARPGGNVTGLTTLNSELGGKRLEPAQRSGSQTCPYRGSLQSGQQSGHYTRGERGSPGRSACTAIDYSALGGTNRGEF
jgi:ABC transporter substrate binding protein